MAIKVKAKSKGYFGHLREPGETFDVESEKQLGKWMEVLSGAPKSKDDDGEGKAPNAAQLAEQIKDSEDLEFLAEMVNDSRSTVKAAAEKRIKELQG